MHSHQLKAALTEFAEQVGVHLRGCVSAGEEVPFELDSRSSRGRGSPSLYCYRPLTDAFIAQRFPQLRAQPAYGSAVQLLAGFPGLDRYLLALGCDPGRARGAGRADAALLAFLQSVFEEHTDFALSPERLSRGLQRIEASAQAGPAEVSLVGTLHGLAISSPELALTSGLSIVQPDAFPDAPEQALRPGQGENGHLLVVYCARDPHAERAAAQGVEVLRDLLRALRLFGDGRIALSSQAWTRVASGTWTGMSLGGSGHPHGMLLVAPDQEDELRAFCNLVSRRTPCEGPIAWALERFEMGCERPHEYQALSDHLLALRALLAGPRTREPEGSSSGLLAARLAALCATPEHRAPLTERALGAIALEREIVAGTAVEHAGGLELAREIANHLRALLRDVICGHLPADLVSLADELLLSGERLGEEPGEGRLGEERLIEHREEQHLDEAPLARAG